MKKLVFISVVLVLLVMTLLVAYAGTDPEQEAYILLKPGQSAAVICDDHQSPQVNLLRVGGARVTCPQPDTGRVRTSVENREKHAR